MIVPQEIIRKKRDGKCLTHDEITEFCTGYLENKVHDYQMSAFLMAIAIKGLNFEETSILTKIMRDSGDVFKWHFDAPIVSDKHSTGGIGDKTSLIILPLCVLEGLKIPMISGRGLGHTGGTLDKLESIEGLNVQISKEQAQKLVHTIGGAFMGQTNQLAPLDKKLYALRDVTATVESIPLITASILSKKLAEGLNNLIMDVKFGSGAFMQKKSDALLLAKTIKAVAKECNINISCFLTNMNSPLGRAAGNALEVKECIQILKGSKEPKDTIELSIKLSARLIKLAYPQKSEKQIIKTLHKHLNSGHAFEIFCKITQAQGANIRMIENPQLLPSAKYHIPVYPLKNGYISKINVRNLGIAILTLGGGRKAITDSIDHSVGLTELKHVGEKVITTEPLAIIEANDIDKANIAKTLILNAYKISNFKPTKEDLIWKII